ncbi:hypothetical protein V5O48_011915 [Marasmius crinis-equi]|uniref:AAA-ATPase-like domain-containing protein n=1 Tax=Marasmius crinis-equi TaxID=585013 RepID=A0ABR3F480_9AGAR
MLENDLKFPTSQKELRSLNTTRPWAMRVYPAYNQGAVKMMLGELSSLATDFKTLVGLGHYRDKTAILNFTRERPCVFFRSPRGYGKTSIMVNHFYDFRLTSSFADSFYGTEAETLQGGVFYRRNNCFTLNFDFGQFNLEAPEFDLNNELNLVLEKVVEGYNLFAHEKSEEFDYRSPVAAETFGNIIEGMIRYGDLGSKAMVVCIDDYDRLYWDAVDLVSEQKRPEIERTMGDLLERIFFLKAISDIADEGRAHGLYGFSEKDVRGIGKKLDYRFHSLGLDTAADDFLKSEQARLQFAGSGHLGYSCDAVLEFFHDRLKDVAKDVVEEKAKRVPI